MDVPYVHRKFCSHEDGFINVEVVSRTIVYKPYWKCDVSLLIINIRHPYVYFCFKGVL